MPREGALWGVFGAWAGGLTWQWLLGAGARLWPCFYGMLWGYTTFPELELGSGPPTQQILLLPALLKQLLLCWLLQGDGNAQLSFSKERAAQGVFGETLDIKAQSLTVAK